MEDLKAGRHVDLPAAAQAIEAFLTALGHPPGQNSDLRDTGRLVAKAFHEELLAGHRVDAASALGETIAASGGDLIVVRDIAVTCICPHHLLPASGVLHVGYLPSDRIVGLGGIARLARAFASRLILQETLCELIAESLVRELSARGAACVADLAPACVTARGACAASASVVTAATSGILRSDPALRSEFYALIHAHKAR